MSGKTEPSQERLLQLLAEHATQLLDSKSTTELADLLSLHPECNESYFEPSVAAIDLAMMPPPSELLPKRLRDRILLDACRLLESKEN